MCPRLALLEEFQNPEIKQFCDFLYEKTAVQKMVLLVSSSEMIPLTGVLSSDCGMWEGLKV